LLIDDVRAESRARGPLTQLPDIGPAMFVPLSSGARRVGTLGLLKAADRQRFDEQTQQYVAGFAAQAALALELARAQLDQRQLLVLEDRDRIARDLHDLVIQRLFATGMLLQGASRLVTNEDAAGRLHRAVDDLDETIREIRTTIFGLQAPPDTTPSVRAAALRVVDEVTGDADVETSVRLGGPIDSLVDVEAGEHVVAALREALSNAVRHSNASRIEVSLEAGDDLVLTVVDDGVGFAEGGRRSGLVNIDQRATRLGGKATVESSPGNGTRINWRVPLR
jgi:two-component system, NarL family, sensor histidine kinase DevS